MMTYCSRKGLVVTKKKFLRVLFCVLLLFIGTEWKLEMWKSQKILFDGRSLKKREEINNHDITSMIGRLKNITEEKADNIAGKNIILTESCTQQNNIVFIKTHKTGSSTFTNILNRFADLRELSVVLPIPGQFRFTWPRKFHWSNVDLLRLDGQPANILTNHARYDRQQMDLIMANDTQYVTILRHPVTQFESSFYYFEFDKILQLENETDPLRTFMAFPDEYFHNVSLKLNSLPDTINLIQSGMFYDLGYNFLDVQEGDAIKTAIDQLETEIKLVMIMEYFDESLVVLRLEMCWQMDDILYIKQNQRSKRTPLANDLKQRIREWNRADTMLYQHFNKTLWKKIATYGDKFWKDLKEFRYLNSKFKRVCSPLKITKKGFKINVNVTEYVMDPKVDRFNRYLCGKALTNEMTYLTYFRKKYDKRYGYQKLLIEEGLKPQNRTNILQRRIAKQLAKIRLANKENQALTLE